MSRSAFLTRILRQLCGDLLEEIGWKLRNPAGKLVALSRCEMVRPGAEYQEGRDCLKVENQQNLDTGEL